MRASGCTPSALARAALITTSALAPSLICEALPAVTVPSFLKAGLSLPSDSAVASARTPSSVLNAVGGPFFCGSSSAKVSSSNLPAAAASAAFLWLAAAKASCAARSTSYFWLTSSAVRPMWKSLYTSHRPSQTIESISCEWPRRAPARASGKRYGALDMLSMPPHTATSMSPARIACAASITALRPEPHTLLTVKAPTESGTPPRRAAWRAGFCPSPAASTQPRITSSTAAGSTRARRRASATASPPSSVALKPASEPWNLPIGVRQALAMTTSCIGGLRARRRRWTAEAGARRAPSRESEPPSKRPWNIAARPHPGPATAPGPARRRALRRCNRPRGRLPHGPGARLARPADEGRPVGRTAVGRGPEGAAGGGGASLPRALPLALPALHRPVRGRPDAARRAAPRPRLARARAPARRQLRRRARLVRHLAVPRRVVPLRGPETPSERQTARSSDDRRGRPRRSARRRARAGRGARHERGRRARARRAARARRRSARAARAAPQRRLDVAGSRPT